MAEQKKKPTAKKTTSSTASSPTLFDQLAPYIIGFIAVFLAACLIIQSYVGFAKYIGVFLCGLFSWGAYSVPVFLMYMAIFYTSNRKSNLLKQKWIYMAVSVVFISVFCSLISPMKTYTIGTLYIEGTKLHSGGVVGGYIYNLLELCIGSFGVAILAAIVLLVFITLIFGKSPTYIFGKIVKGIRTLFKKIGSAVKNLFQRSIDDGTEEEETQRASVSKKPVQLEMSKDTRKKKTQENYQVDIPIDDTPAEDMGESILELESKSERMPREVCDPEVERDINDTLINIFAPQTKAPIQNQIPADDGETFYPEVTQGEAIVNEVAQKDSFGLEDEPTPTTEADESAQDIEEEKEDIITDTPAEPAVHKYKFPPISLLKKEEHSAYNSEEMYRQVGQKLVETLKSFRVNTEIINISKGPAVTRYELKPERGIKVKSIINLADDIALNLAATGVRIEAPIPGQEAVGVEIPNKTVSTVYVRELIENSAFTNSKSKLTTCLGMNVAGEPIYCDIAKMPHLLIAGATGMGKSVCINSLIVSMLYKATPDELKLILIDPKKVELSIYNGIPHLLVPVVSDPKRAAGSLCWAVGEMERRFALIEEVGVRDIRSYNEAIKMYEEREALPHIVIIIDELADLMMMARDDVESSICRLAQKARAAGMHLIIGTQRPSVDVITGLIKANIPSRIAFTVASQVDSRTIIDISGAEKLIGRGDMLYAPVGFSKPLRVQGCFVSESEVEAVTGFIKDSLKAEYSNEIIQSIEAEAEKCGEKKGKGGAASGVKSESGVNLDSDEMLKPAIEIAFEAGAISASLIQRRLSLGYARSARLVDYMYNLGIIGPFSGAKPRQVIISRERYAEMLMNSDSEK